jgi:hypothetical protein
MGRIRWLSMGSLSAERILNRPMSGHSAQTISTNEEGLWEINKKANRDSNDKLLEKQCMWVENDVMAVLIETANSFMDF